MMTAKQVKRVGVAVVVLLLGAGAQAQEVGRLQKGDRLFTLSGSGSSDRDMDSSVASIELGMGWFVADPIAVALRQGVNVSDYEGRSDWNGSTRLGLDFFLDLDRLKPFVGAGIGYVYGDMVKNQFIAGPNVGLLCFVNHTTFVSLGLTYQILFKDADEARDVYKDGMFVYALGMGVKW